jgi:hypothetical protein
MSEYEQFVAGGFAFKVCEDCQEVHVRVLGPNGEPRLDFSGTIDTAKRFALDLLEEIRAYEAKHATSALDSLMHAVPAGRA